MNGKYVTTGSDDDDESREKCREKLRQQRQRMIRRCSSERVRPGHKEVGTWVTTI